MMIRWMLTVAALAASAGVLAKLPPLDEAAKAKAAEAAAKAAWQGKLDNYQLCKVQDRLAARYKANRPAEAKADSAAQASAATAAAARPVPTRTTASQGGSTPVAAVAANPPPPPCADPGPFAYTPPDQKPLEASGAHSPAGNATSPPSVRTPSAEMRPAKPGVATKP